MIEKNYVSNDFTFKYFKSNRREIVEIKGVHLTRRNS